LNRSVAEFLVIAELTPRQKDAYRLMLDAAPKIWGRLTDSTNLTVTHGDMHWWNFLFPQLKPECRPVSKKPWGISDGMLFRKGAPR
jgi:hypothetical protein